MIEESDIYFFTSVTFNPKPHLSLPGPAQSPSQSLCWRRWWGRSSRTELLLTDKLLRLHIYCKIIFNTGRSGIHWNAADSLAVSHFWNQHRFYSLRDWTHGLPRLNYSYRKLDNDRLWVAPPTAPSRASSQPMAGWECWAYISLLLRSALR